MQQEVIEKSKGVRKQGNNPTNSSTLVNAERPSNCSKQTSHKKRELEQDLTTDVPAKCTKADDSKKVGGLGVKEPGNNHPETVAASKPSKWPKPSKLLEPSKPSKLDEKKRKHLDVQEPAESSQPITPFGIKELNKIESIIGKVCLLSS